MKVVVCILLMFICFSCGNQVNENLKVSEWENILDQALAFSDISNDNDIVKVYESYSNSGLVDSLVAFYYYGRNKYGYSIKDSLIEVIRSGSKKKLIDRYAKASHLNVETVSDTTLINTAYIVLSEPYLIDSNLIMMSIERKGKFMKGKEWWIYFFYKQKGIFKLNSIYDFQKDVIYENRPPR